MTARSALACMMVLACGHPETQAVTVEPLPQPPPSATATPVATASAPPVTEHIDVLEARDTRRGHRAAGLLATEINGLESLLAATPNNAPDRPQLLRRLAEDYVEQRKANGGDGHLAIERYRALLDGYPSYPLADEARYDLALELEIAGDASQARRVYLDLIQKHPSSRYVPAAYFAFGEMFVREAKQDPSKWELARQAYYTVDVRAPKDILWPWAMLRSGQVLERQGEGSQAAAMYAKLRSEAPRSEAASHIGEPL